MKPRKVAPAMPPVDDDRTDYKALSDWVARGCPDDEIVYDEDAPRTTREDWKDAEEVEFRFTPKRKTAAK